MVDITPAILPKSFAGLEGTLEKLVGVTRKVQVDVVDGTFVSNTTWPYTEPDSFASIVSEDEGLPFWESFDFEFDLMLAHPDRDVETFVRAGAARIVLHTKSSGITEALDLLQSYREGMLKVEVGLALSLDETAEVLAPYAGLYDFVQVMGIEKVGFQGQPFDTRVLALVAAVHAEHPNMPIQVDGGVNLDHIQELVRAGATCLIAGSAVVGADNPRDAFRALYTRANAQ